MQSHSTVRLHSDQKPGGFLVSPQHLTFADIDTAWGYDDFDYLFAIVRNPFSRMESEFRMRNKLRGKGFFGGELSFSSWLERSLLDARANPQHMDNHLRPQWHFISDKLRIFKFEDGIANILARISADLDLPPPPSVPHSLATSEQAAEFVWDRAEMLRMREYYALDFETLGYDSEPSGDDERSDNQPERLAPRFAPMTEVVPETDIPCEVLAAKYISLGDNCEFGFVQRHYGLEDGSLLRWAISFPEVLTKNIRNGFEGLFQFDNLVPYSDKMVDDQYSGLKFHSAMYSKERVFTASESERREIYESESKKITYLRDKLSAGLSDANSVFIYKHNHGTNDETARALAAALRERGNARLMVVHSGAGPAVRQVEDNLFYGYIPKFATYAQASQPDLPSWTTLLRIADPIIFAQQDQDA